MDGAVDASETLRLKYRYLELRRQKVYENFHKRHLTASLIREYLNSQNFIEVETWPDKEDTWARTSKIPLYNSENECVGIIGITSDVTDLVMAEKTQSSSLFWYVLFF